MILVPVIVLDKSTGKHVPHLTADDFEVQENGETQPIKAFEEVASSTTRLQHATLQPGFYTNSLSGDTSSRVLTIIVLDSINTPFLDQTRVRQALITFLGSAIQNNSLVALLNLNGHGIQTLHDFTDDPGVLIAALKKVQSSFPAMTSAASPVDIAEARSTAAVPGSNDPVDQLAQRLSFFAGGNDSDSVYAGFQQANAIADTLEALEYIAHAYGSIPGRKALIWATAAFPFQLDPDSAGILGATSPVDLYQGTLRALNQANIAVYPVDVRGLVVGLPDAGTRPNRVNVYAPQVTISGAQDYLLSSHQTMQEFATMTGGHAYYNRNDLDQAFHDAADDGSSYYLLGYYLNHKNTRPGWRKLSVHVRRDNVRVHSRSGFFVTRAMADPQQDSDLEVRLAATSPFDYTALPFVAQIQSPIKKGEVSFELFFPTRTGVVDTADQNHFSLDIVVVARDHQGNDKGHLSKTVQGNLSPEHLAQIADGNLTYLGKLELPPGDYSLRFVVRDKLRGRVGTVSAPVTMP